MLSERSRVVYGTANINNAKLKLRLLATDGPNLILALLDKSVA